MVCSTRLSSTSSTGHASSTWLTSSCRPREWGRGWGHLAWLRAAGLPGPRPSLWGCGPAGQDGSWGLAWRSGVLRLPPAPPRHLPAYLVAAFTKRLARLALTAPPEALLTVLPFICNLLRRHPACRVLVHRPRGPGECGRSPWEAWPRGQHVGAGGRMEPGSRS